MTEPGISVPPAGEFPALEDIYSAMQEIGAYYDITVDDFRNIYQHAYALARKRLFQTVPAASLMSTPVVTIPENATIGEAAALLDGHGISGAPVADEGKAMIGILSQKDICRHVGTRIGIAVNTALSLLTRPVPEDVLAPLLRTPAQAVMRDSILSISPETPLGDIIALFARRKINRAPVTDTDGQLRGIVSRSDVIACVGGLL